MITLEKQIEKVTSLSPLRIRVMLSDSRCSVYIDAMFSGIWWAIGECVDAAVAEVTEILTSPMPTALGDLFRNSKQCHVCDRNVNHLNADDLCDTCSSNGVTFEI